MEHYSYDSLESQLWLINESAKNATDDQTKLQLLQMMGNAFTAHFNCPYLLSYPVSRSREAVQANIVRLTNEIRTIYINERSILSILF